MSELEKGSPVRELYSAINQQDVEALGRVFADNVDYVDYGLGKKLKGKEEIKKHFQNWWTAFPKGSGEIVNLISSGDQVVAEVVGRGNQTGPFETPGKRVQPSNQAFEFHFSQIFKIRDGKIVEWRTYSDVSKIAASSVLKNAA